MLICAIRLFAANNPDKSEFTPDKSAQKCSELIDALFNDRCTVEWGRHMLAVVSHGQVSNSTDYSGGDLLRLSVADCVGLLRAPLHEIDFNGELPPSTFFVSEPTSEQLAPVKPEPLVATLVETAPPAEPIMPVTQPDQNSANNGKPIPPPPPPPPVKSGTPIAVSADGHKYNAKGVRIISIVIGESIK
jgi:hypothetical protein